MKGGKRSRTLTPLPNLGFIACIYVTLWWRRLHLQDHLAYTPARNLPTSYRQLGIINLGRDGSVADYTEISGRRGELIF